jgi:hypothetical protein
VDEARIRYGRGGKPAGETPAAPACGPFLIPSPRERPKAKSVSYGSHRQPSRGAPAHPQMT